MTLYVHRAQATDLLADSLAVLLARPSDDPFAEEVVAVPARGVERWLAQRLSHRLGASAGHDGVCAGVRFLSPHSLVALVLGVERDDPWRPDQLTWPVLRAIDTSLGEPWARVLSTHLGYGVTGVEGELLRGRRYAVARRLAGLFADYALQRPQLLTDWAAGGSGDGLGGEVADDLAWQPELWRRVLALVDAEAPDVRHRRVVTGLREGRLEGLELPGRLSLFGHTRIARAEAEVLGALGAHRDVHLWLPQASPAAWEALSRPAAAGPVPRDEDSSVALVQHHLLASLGRDARELQRTLAPLGGVDRPGAPLLDAVASGSQPPTLLRLLQSDIAADHQPTSDELDRAERRVGADDRSLQVHACHGQGRQVEVLRDVLADLLQQDPTLEPRDVVVMCPDVETYSPLLHAGFGLGEVVGSSAHPAHGLRVRVADRAPVQTNPLLALAVRLVELAGGRVTAGEVLDLARSEPVRRRFGLDDDDLERLGDWASEVAVRWGLDVEHREGYGLRNVAQNTWAAGLERVLVGAAVDGRDTAYLGTVLALDDLDSGDLDLAGRVAELVERLRLTLRSLRDADTVDEWTSTLTDGVLGLADAPAREGWQRTQLERELARVRDASRRTGRTSLSLADVRALLTEHTAGRATRSSFRTGTLTVCTMVPMRSVPHRVVCLVGLDDGVFPRTTTPDGDDALARRPVTGERDLRSEDRQLLLDALMSARETLVVTYTGFDIHTGQVRPPAVPLGELIDAARATARGAGVDRLVTEHPLQPFDPRNLGATTPDEPPLLPDGRPFTYDPVALAGGRARQSELSAPLVLATAELPEPVDGGDADVIAVDDLLRFFDHPGRAFLRGRLGLVLPEVPEIVGEGIPIELDGLQRWAIGDRVLQAVLSGVTPSDAVAAEQWRGELPPDALGHATLATICEDAQRLAQATWSLTGLGGWGVPLERTSLDIDVALPDGRHVAGTVGGLVRGEPLLVTYSTIKGKQRLRTWITGLLLAAAGNPVVPHAIGKHSWGHGGRGDKDAGHFFYSPPSPEEALELLGQLVGLRDRGLQGVLPLPVDTGLAWAEVFRSTGREHSAHQKAVRAWETGEGGYGIPREQDDPSWTRLYGERPPYSLLTTDAPDDERWEPDVTSRIGQLALRVWGPALAAAHVERPRT